MPRAAEIWAPPAHAPEPMQVGVHWDAVRIPADIGERVLVVLGPDSGAVIADTRGSHRLYWLIPTGSADTWGPSLPRTVTVLRDTTTETVYLGVPPENWTSGPGLHWRVPPWRPGDHLTAPERLQQALAATTAAERMRRTAP